MQKMFAAIGGCQHFVTIYVNCFLNLENTVEGSLELSASRMGAASIALVLITLTKGTV